MKTFCVAISYLLLLSIAGTAQRKPIVKVKFFADETTIEAALVVPLKKLTSHKESDNSSITGRFISKLPEGTDVDEQLIVEQRGHFRRDYCFIPPLKVTFNKTDSSVMHPLKSLKLVSICRAGNDYQNYLFKEFLIYKMFNQLTQKTFRVRLLKLEYVDSSEKKNPIEGYAFLMEDIKELAKRNACLEIKNGTINTESTDRQQMTLVALFEYMIGNTDWAVPVRHNIKIMRLSDKPDTGPFAVPYDFDYSGLVNTSYAIPDPLIGTESVVERVYRGFPRNMAELQIAFDVFNAQKENIYALINNFELLPSQSRKAMIKYLEEFYKLINDARASESIFVKNARTK